MQYYFQIHVLPFNCQFYSCSTIQRNFPISKTVDFVEISLEACYFAMGPIITLITLLTEIVKEKEFRLRNGLNVVGVGHNVYWFTWILVAVLINAG